MYLTIFVRLKETNYFWAHSNGKTGKDSNWKDSLVLSTLKPVQNTGYETQLTLTGTKYGDFHPWQGSLTIAFLVSWVKQPPN